MVAVSLFGLLVVAFGATASPVSGNSYDAKVPPNAHFVKTEICDKTKTLIVIIAKSITATGSCTTKTVSTTATITHAINSDVVKTETATATVVVTKVEALTLSSDLTVTDVTVRNTIVEPVTLTTTDATVALTDTTFTSVVATNVNTLTITAVQTVTATQTLNPTFTVTVFDFKRRVAPMAAAALPAKIEARSNVDKVMGSCNERDQSQACWCLGVRPTTVTEIRMHTAKPMTKTIRKSVTVLGKTKTVTAAYTSVVEVTQHATVTVTTSVTIPTTVTITAA